ncbi:MAG: LLM class flavin-dependent oxidoreductase [Chromatiales bacterium]|nr:LLM class flavin-dependent oxidoreductase [Chromatiales bacterium]
MRFSIAVNMLRTGPDEDMRKVIAETLEMVKLADEGGFEVIWAAEHHCIELTVAPNPFLLLTHWAEHTSRARLGTAVVVAPYWNPIRLAGEAALTDLYTDGRLELGIARGAFQYEFDRMAPGLRQELAGDHVTELVPAVQALWAGDYAHEGKIWRFPKATSVPKPLQRPHPPIWIAARGQDTFDMAVRDGHHIMSTPLGRPFAEIGILADRLADAMSRHPDRPRPRWMVLRRACCYERPEQWSVPIDAALEYSRRFEGLFGNRGTVENGFPRGVSGAEPPTTGDFSPQAMRENLLFGTPEELIEKLEGYRAAGVDQLCYGADFGLEHGFAMRSLARFIERVMPHFA